jgi:hypothetical protein
VDHCKVESPYISTTYLWKNFSPETKRCELVRKYSLAIEEVVSFSVSPAPIIISLELEQAGASFSDSVDLLSIANNLQSINSETKEKHTRSEEGNITTFVHEYGHTVFSHLLKKDLPHYLHISKSLVESTTSLIELNFYVDRRAYLEQRIEYLEANELSYTEEYIALQDELSEVGFAIFTSFSMNNSHSNAINNEVDRINKLISPYTELFADLVTVLYRDNPKAMYEAVIYPDMNKEDEFLSNGRDFTIDRDINQWNSKVGHIALSPVRSILYKEFIKPGMSQEDKRELLMKLYKACKVEIDNRWNEGLGDTVEMNLELSKLLREQ